MNAEGTVVIVAVAFGAVLWGVGYLALCWIAG